MDPADRRSRRDCAAPRLSTFTLSKREFLLFTVPLSQLTHTASIATFQLKYLLRMRTR